MKKIVTILFMVLSIAIGGNVYAQRYSYDFGTTANSLTTGSSTSFFPALPSGGATYARVGTGAGSINLVDGSPNLDGSTGMQFNGVAPTAASVNKAAFNTITGAGQTFGIEFDLHLSGGSLGTWYFFLGNGATFANSNGFTGAEVFVGLRFVFGASSAITTSYRNGGSWSAAPVGSPSAQATTYKVAIYANNSTSSVNYTHPAGGTSYSVAADKFDLFIDGTLVGNDLSKAALGAATNIDDFMFYGESSTGNVAKIDIDNLQYTTNIASSPLPIELADFTAQTSNGDVTLNWQTISEINSDVFEVQHLADGEWVTVATVQAAGASTDVRSYTQAVKGLQVGTHYFRLKSVDKDGGVKYSKQIAVAVEVPGTFVMNPAYPNPFNPQTTLTFAVAKKQAVTMTLFNALGQQISVLYQGSPEANTLQTVQLNGSTLQSGAYFVRLTGENFSGMQKVMLVK